MNIEILENRLESITDEHYSSIIELIINAVREYPIFGLNDTGNYFEEVKKKLGVEEITLNALRKHIDRNSEVEEENNIWLMSSLSSLIEALELMELYKITFDEVNNMIKTIET